MIRKEFMGKVTEQMPKLIAEGRIPLSVAGVMEKRLNMRDVPYDDGMGYWKDNSFVTGDALVYHPDGRVKIILDSKTLREITPESTINAGTLVLTEDIYDSLSGEEFKKGECGKLENYLSKEEAKSHPIWRILARDQALLNDYVDYFFTGEKIFFTGGSFKRLRRDGGMGIYMAPGTGSKTPRMGILENCGFTGGAQINVSQNIDHYKFGLDYDSNRLIGVFPRK